jgi:hypothetical protein
MTSSKVWTRGLALLMASAVQIGLTSATAIAAGYGKHPPGRWICASPRCARARRLAEKALAGVVQEAYVHGISTRSVDDLVKAMGMTGTSKSKSAGCADLFRPRPSGLSSCASSLDVVCAASSW